MTAPVVVIIRAEDPVAVIQHLDNHGIDAVPHTTTSIKMSLDVERGDEVFEKADGSIRVSQDAMVATLTDAQISEVTWQA